MEHQVPDAVVIGVAVDEDHGRVAGVAALLYTDVGRDGMLKGCNVEATVDLARATKIPVIASGGCSGYDDMLAAFKAGADAKLGADVLFVYEGTDVHAQTKSLKVEGDKIELVITWEIQGTFASTKLVGSLKGNEIAGTYESTAAEEPATGKWSVSRS